MAMSFVLQTVFGELFNGNVVADTYLGNMLYLLCIELEKWGTDNSMHLQLEL